MHAIRRDSERSEESTGSQPIPGGFLPALLRLVRGLLLFGAVAAACAAPLVVATYNVENYLPADRMVEGVYRKAYPKPEADKQALRTVIRALNADVLALQEMGSQAYLDELQRDLRAEGLDYPHAVLMEGPDSDRHVAVLSKLKPKAVQPHPLLGFRYFDDRAAVKRGLLELTLETPAGDLTFFVVHLKSRYTDRGDDPMSALLRANEAEAVRNLVLRRFPDPAAARFLIIGDCNDVPGSKPLRLLTKRGDTVIAKMLPAVDVRGETWTHFYHKDQTYSRIDYLLASPGARPLVRDGAVRVYDGPGVREASDHRPVVAVLDVDRK